MKFNGEYKAEYFPTYETGEKYIHKDNLKEIKKIDVGRLFYKRGTFLYVLIQR